MKTCFTVLFMLCAYLLSMAQTNPDTSIYRIQTIDGNEYIGTVVSEDTENIKINTQNLGVITIQKSAIKKLTRIDGEKMEDGLYWFDNPQSTRYFWQPNGFGLKKGEGYYQNVWIFFNQVSYGITDNLLIGAGVVPMFLFAGSASPVWLTPKLSFPIVENKFNIGAGALIGTIIGGSESGFGMLYGTTTFGNRNTNLSLGLGYGYAGGELANAPTISLSAMIRTGQRGYVLTENYFISTGVEDVFLLFIGGRRLIKNAGLDYGFVIPAFSETSFVAFPWIGLTFPFGNTYVPKAHTIKN